MSDIPIKLAHAPIVECILDIECDMPLVKDLASIEAASRDCFRDTYPKFRQQYVQEHIINTKQDQAPAISFSQKVQALQFLVDDEKQIVQIRLKGFTFNKLAPYGSFDEYLPEIERTWKLFIKLTSPSNVRVIRLRYINRILLPLEKGNISLEKYLNLSFRLPHQHGITFRSFLNQSTAVENASNNQIVQVLTTQVVENDKLPVIFDNWVFSDEVGESEDWSWISRKILELRDLKNRIFNNTLTSTCLNLFQ